MTGLIPLTWEQFRSRPLTVGSATQTLLLLAKASVARASETADPYGRRPGHPAATASSLSPWPGMGTSPQSVPWARPLQRVPGALRSPNVGTGSAGDVEGRLLRLASAPGAAQARVLLPQGPRRYFVRSRTGTARPYAQRTSSQQLSSPARGPGSPYAAKTVQTKVLKPSGTVVSTRDKAPAKRSRGSPRSRVTKALPSHIPSCLGLSENGASSGHDPTLRRGLPVVAKWARL